MPSDPTDNAQVIFGQPTPLPGLFVAMPTARDVAVFLGWDGSEATDQITQHLNTVISMVRSYTRGLGFRMGPSGLEVREDLSGVLVQCTARSATNPSQTVRLEVAGYSEVMTPFTGFTLTEMLAMNKYRRRTA